MKGLSRLLYIFVLLGFFATDVWADKPKILQLKDLEPGTKAIGFSVFKDVEPLPFDVVLGNTTDSMGNSFILARISGGPMDTPLENIGAISGMSGSPIFIGCNDLDDCIKNGTLVGALSYSVGYFIQGGMNCLLTPAEYMLGARFEGYVEAAQFSNRMPNKINIGGMEFFNLMLFPKIDNLAGQEVSAGKCDESTKSELKPGSMITVFLAKGLIPIGASGTVTWVDGNKIYIFGHPLYGTGMVSYPFVHVAVADTIQTPFNAYKIAGCYLDIKGAILVDGAFEMAGVIGATASMLPYQVELSMGNGGAILSEEIAVSPLSSTVIKSLPILWAQQLVGDVSHLSIVYQIRIAVANQPEIFVKNTIPAQIYQKLKNPPENENSFKEVFDKVYGSLQIMKESGFNHTVEGIKVRLNVIKDFGLWTAKKSFLSQEKASPGETVYANVVLEELSSFATKQISIPIKIPEDFMERVDSGTSPNITVLVQAGKKFTDKREQLEATSIEELIKQLNQAMNYQTDVLYVQQIMPRPKAENEVEKTNAKTSIKPAWKWADIGEGDLRQFPKEDGKEVVLSITPTLGGFIDFDATFNIVVQSSKDKPSETKKETKNKKWFLFFLF